MIFTSPAEESCPLPSTTNEPLLVGESTSREDRSSKLFTAGEAGRDASRRASRLATSEGVFEEAVEVTDEGRLEEPTPCI